jgi:hypothetical protein
MIFAPSGTMTGTMRGHRVDPFAGMRVFVRCGIRQTLQGRRLTAPLPAWGLIALGPAWAICGVYPPKKGVSPEAGIFLALLKRRFGNPPYWDHPHALTPAASR